MNTISGASVAALILLAVAYAFAAEGDTSPILGQWFTEGEESVVEIYESDDAYCGRIIWLEEPHYPDGTDKKDKNNPDESLRDRTIVGMNIVWGFREKRANTWTGGTIYDPNNGKSYSCNARLKGDKLSIRGYVGTPLLGRTTVWTKKQ